MSTVAEVRLWGRRIGAVSLAEGQPVAAFQYTPEFARSGIEVSPLRMPLAESIYTFPGLARETFRGLPGLLADSLPDRYGNALIDAWLAAQGREPGSFNVVERLCYIGRRGMGALEYLPAIGPEAGAGEKLDVGALVKLASAVLSHRAEFLSSLAGEEREAALEHILSVGTSAGGARAKAVIAWNPKSNEVRSGQIHPGDGFEHWLLKLDGVSGSGDHGLADPLGYGSVEYGYYLMARAAGIRISGSQILEEGGRRHFMTRRFDRAEDGGKIHMQSLGGLAHLDFNDPGSASYEQALLIARQLEFPMGSIEELFRRMVFNVLARNQDDHVKNIAFLMDRAGRWSLAPAFDLTYAFNPSGRWTARHQMSVNGRREGFGLADLRAVAAVASMKRGRAEAIHEQVREAVGRWPEFAAEAKVDDERAAAIGAAHLRLS